VNGHAEAQQRCSEADKRGIKQFLVHQIVLVIEHGTAWGANAKCVQLKYAIEVDRCRYRNACAAEEILLWIHKGHVVTVWSWVLWTDHLDLYLKNQSDKSMQDNRVGVGVLAILEGAGEK